MKASFLDLRRRMRDVLRALEQNEPVTILYRGKKKGIMYSIRNRKQKDISVSEHPAFGMWKNRDDLQDVGQAVRDIRKGRSHAV